MTVSGARWDVGENLALASEIPNVGYDLDQLVGVDQNWSIDTSAVVQAAIDAVSAAGGGEIVVRNEGRTYHWSSVVMRSNVGIRFLGNPTVLKGEATSQNTHVFDFLGAESDTLSLLTADHPLATLTVSTASWVSNVATVTTVETHNILVGDEVQVSTVSPSGYTGLFTVTVVNAGAKTFSYAKTTDPGAYVSGGEVDPMQYLVHPTDATGFAVGDVVMIADDEVEYALSQSPINVSTASWDSGTKIATLTFASRVSGATKGDPIRIAGVSSSGPGSFNGVFAAITHPVVGTTVTFKLQTNPGTYTSGGTGQFVEGQHLELNKIKAIVGNTISMQRPLIRDYRTSSNARLVKLDACEGAYIIGPATFQIPDYVGANGGGVWFNYAYNCRAESIDVYGPSDDAAFFTQRSGLIRVNKWGAYNGQHLVLGGYAYGPQANSSSHDISFTHGFASHVRECPAATNGAMYVTFENNEVMGTYASGINTHGSGCHRIRIANNRVIAPQGVGIVISIGGSTVAADTDVDVLDNEIWDSRRGGIEVEGHPDGTKNVKRVRVKGNRFYRPKRENAVLVMYAEDVEVEDNRIEGEGADPGQAMIYVHDAVDVSVKDNGIRGGGSDYGIRWATVTGLDVAGNRIKDVVSHNLWGATSSDVKLGPNVMDDTDVLLEGTETLVGSESLAGALRATLADTDITPDPVYRYHAWSISQARTMNAPTNTKRVVGQRITFDITNTALIPVTPVWDAAFVLGAPFRLKAA